MIKSMTGFGRCSIEDNGKKFLVEVKTVNHRYMDIFMKLPRQLSYLEDKVREVVSKTISRGKVDIFISFEDTGEDSKTVMLDEALTKAYIKALDLMKQKYGVSDEVSMSLLSKFPDVLRVEKVEEDEETIWRMLKTALEGALTALIGMRTNEGEKLKSSILEKAKYIETVMNIISDRSPEVVKEYKTKLENRINELLNQQTIDENRLAMEVAVFADRCSIDEEIVRMTSHLIQLRDILNSDQPVGRKLDFLVQEMNREINTIGSKANDLDITKNVIELKSEIEKIREQVQNIE